MYLHYRPTSNRVAYSVTPLILLLISFLYKLLNCVINNTTRDALSKSFKRDLGISLKQYLNNRIISEASILLKTDLIVKEIAERLGFRSPFYFSRFFKKQAKISPTVFRKQYAQNSLQPSNV